MALSVQNRKLQAAEALRQEVLTARIAPDADLDEAALCLRFGLSRTPMREVFRDLAGDGYLSLHANRGARAAPLSHKTLRAFFQAAPMIYGAVLQLAAENATAAQIVELKQAQEEFCDALQSGGAAERALANNRFHALTGDMAYNPYLVPSFRRLLIDHARIGMTFYQPASATPPAKLQTASDQHEAIIAAIAARDAAAASQLAQDHWALSRDEIARFVMPAALDAPMGALLTKETA